MGSEAGEESGSSTAGVFSRYLRALAWRPVVGYSCLSTWTQIVFSDRFASAASGGASTIAVVHMAGSALALLTALALVFLARAVAPLSGRRAVVGATGLLAALSAVGLALIDQGIMSPDCLVVCNGLAAVTSVVLMLAWYERLAARGVVGVLATLGAAAIVGSAFYFVVMALAGPWGDLLLAVLPLVAAGLLVVAPATAPALPVPASTGLATSLASVRSIVPLLIIVGLANYANGTYLNLALEIPTATGLAGVAYESLSRMVTVLPAVVLAAVCVRAHIRVAFCISTGCVLVASLITFAWPEAPIQLLLLLVHAGVELMGFLTVAVLVEAVEQRRASATLLFALYSVVLFAGTLVGQVSSAVFAHNRALTAVLLMVVLVAMLMLAFMAHDSIAHPGSLVAPTPAAAADPLDQLAQTCGLSPRELDVARLWVAGHNSAYIEETLSISKHTVRTHLKNIYGKTHTANKEELIRLVEKTS